MLEGHTFRALLDSSIKAGAGFQYQEWLHSLTGPAFLFASGAGFSLATFPHLDLYRTWSPKLGKRLLRWLALLALGYMFHLTYFSLRRTFFEGTPEQLYSLLSMDILQCIAIAGLLLQFLVMVLPGVRSFFCVTAGGAVVIGLVTPLVWEASQRFPMWLGTSLSGDWGSLFPLFPYLGFRFAGAAWGYRLVQARQQETGDGFFVRTSRYSAVLVLGALTAFLLPLSRIYGQFWMTGPTFFFSRLGILGVVLVLFRSAEVHIVPRLPHLNALAVIGRESLVAYAAHVMLLYGSALNRDTNLLKLLGSERRPAEVMLVLILLAGAMVLLCRSWNRLKKSQDWKAKGIQLSLAGYLVYCFVTG